MRPGVMSALLIVSPTTNTMPGIQYTLNTYLFDPYRTND